MCQDGGGRSQGDRGGRRHRSSNSTNFICLPLCSLYTSFRSYPIYHPDKEPGKYLTSLQKREPEIIFDPMPDM